MSITKICSVEGCSKDKKCRTYCQMHYRRFRLYGSPGEATERHEKHGLCYTKEYKSWINMKNRCTNKQSSDYPNYGGRGIKVCDRWRYSFSRFHRDMGKAPEAALTLERKSVNGNYEPGNCQWETRRIQNINQRVKKSNTSGYVGVTYYKRYGKWLAQFSNLNLGYYNTKEEAAYVRDQVVLQLIGTKAPLNLDL